MDGDGPKASPWTHLFFSTFSSTIFIYFFCYLPRLEHLQRVITIKTTLGTKGPWAGDCLKASSKTQK